MIVKVYFGDNAEHVRMVECKDMHFEDLGSHTEMALKEHVNGENRALVMLGNRKHRDDVYIMENGETIDHFSFKPREPENEPKTTQAHPGPK